MGNGKWREDAKWKGKEAEIEEFLSYADAYPEDVQKLIDRAMDEQRIRDVIICKKRAKAFPYKGPQMNAQALESLACADAIELGECDD